MIIKDFYTISGIPEKHNEDKIGFNKSSAWILDGATPMESTIKNIYNSDAAWFVNEINKFFIRNSDLKIKENLKKSLKEIQNIYEKNKTNKEKERGNDIHPSLVR